MLENYEAIEQVSITSEDTPAGSAPITEDGIEAMGPPGTPEPEPTVVEGNVLLEGTLSEPADSPEAATAVRELAPSSMRRHPMRCSVV